MTGIMYNWSIDTRHLKKYPRQYAVWRLEQLINFGLGEEKIDKKELLRYLSEIKIDPDKKKYLKFLLGT